MVKGRLCLARQLLRSNFILSSTCILCCFVRSTVLYVSLWCSTEVQKITMQCSLSYCGFTRLQDFICDHNFMCCASTTLWIFLLFVFPLRWTGQKIFILQTPRSWKLELARHTQNHHSLFVDALKKCSNCTASHKYLFRYAFRLVTAPQKTEPSSVRSVQYKKCKHMCQKLMWAECAQHPDSTWERRISNFITTTAVFSGL